MSFYEILSLTVALSMLFFGACIFIYKLFTLSFKEIKQILTTPTSVLTIITIIIMIISPLIEDFLYYQDSLIVLFFIGLNTIFISRALTLSIRKIKIKIISWTLTILFGIGSFGIYHFIFLIIFRGYPIVDKYFFLSAAIFGLILIILSLIVNIIEKIRISKKLTIGGNIK